MSAEDEKSRRNDEKRNMFHRQAATGRNIWYAVIAGVVASS
jgi:hypothetical protein